MTLIGNDNEKSQAELVTARPPQGGLPGHIPQVLVFLSGLVLTATLFVTLNIFIQEIIDDKINSVSYETQEYIDERYAALEKSLQIAGALISFSTPETSEALAERLDKSLSIETSYDQIYWLERKGDGQYLAHKMLRTRTSDNGAIDTPESRTALHQHVATFLADKNGIQIINPATVQTGADTEPLILGYKVANANGGYDYVYGVSRVSRLFTSAFFDFRKNIEALEVSNKNTGSKLFSYIRAGNGDTDRKFIDLTLSQPAMRLQVAISLNEREMLLKKIPFLTWLFGLVLTIVGTLYVRNNHRQAVRLATMNVELAQKNDKLNHEIVERERLNQTLRRQEKENRAIIDAVSDIIFETSTEGQILFLNETWQKITGFSPERSIGRNLFDLLYMQDQAEQRSNMAQLVKGKKHAYRAFTRLRTADGTFRAIELAVSMLRQDENKDLRIVGTITDVEERRRAERALSEAEKKYRAIVENAASGIYQVTPEGVYLSANAAMARILGFDSQDAVLRDIGNANVEIYYNARERERHLRDAVRNGSVNVEAQVRRHDGQIIWVQENLRAVKDEEEQLLFFEGSLEDISARKQTEIALRDAKVMSDLANRAKSEFLANMSHELRTPLNAIIGFSDIIVTQAFGAVGRGEYLDYARDINDSGKRLLQVINDILDVSRIEAGDRQLNEGIVDIHKVILSGLEMMSQKIEQHKTVISNYVTESAPRLIGEAQAVKQIIMNLLSNAIKFTPEGGRVSIFADVDDDGQMQISITDTGIGLSDDEIEKALSPFGQINTSLNKSESGTGLGLTLVQSLMALHGGTFELFSQKGIGTTATLIFPAKRVSQPAPAQPVPA